MPAGRDAGRVVGLSAFLSLLAASLFFAASATPLPLLIRRRTRGTALALVVATLAVTVAYGISVFTWTGLYAQVPIALPWGSYVTGEITIGLLLFASWRSFRVYSLTRLPMQGALTVGFVLLAEAQVAMAMSPLWSLSWWGYGRIASYEDLRSSSRASPRAKAGFSPGRGCPSVRTVVAMTGEAESRRQMVPGMVRLCANT